MVVPMVFPEGEEEDESFATAEAAVQAIPSFEEQMEIGVAKDANNGEIAYRGASTFNAVGFLFLYSQLLRFRCR